MKTKYVKSKIDKSKQNKKRKLCGDWNEKINHVKTNAAN